MDLPPTTPPAETAPMTKLHHILMTLGTSTIQATTTYPSAALAQAAAAEAARATAAAAQTLRRHWQPVVESNGTGAYIVDRLDGQMRQAWLVQA